MGLKIKFLFSFPVYTLLQYVLILLRSKVEFITLKNQELWLYVKNFNIKFVISFLKLNTYLKYNFLVDIIVVDYPTNLFRFKLIYNLLSTLYNSRLKVHTFSKEAEFLTSIKNLFRSSDWLEREVWDMYGIYFINHNDLRRILTDYGFKGYPLKKDFPLTGYVQLRYNDKISSTNYEPVKLAQELRFFHRSSGWELHNHITRKL